MLSWLGASIPSVVYFFHTFYYQHDTFLNTEFHSNILAVYSYCLYQGRQFFFIFGKYLDIIYVHKGIKLFLWFCKFLALSALSKYVIE